MSCEKSVQGKLWNGLREEQRKLMLGQYFRSKLTINKHKDKRYTELPSNFKDFFARKLLEFLRIML